MKTKIWYSIQNGGDGSAGIELMESEELCKIDQKFLGDDGWGEDCYGWITIESDSPIIVKDKITTAEEAIAEIEEELVQDFMVDYKKAGKYPDWFKRLEGKLKALKAIRTKQIKV